MKHDTPRVRSAAAMLPRSPVLRRPTCGLDPNIARGGCRRSGLEPRESRSRQRQPAPYTQRRKAVTPRFTVSIAVCPGRNQGQSCHVGRTTTCVAMSASTPRPRISEAARRPQSHPQSTPARERQRRTRDRQPTKMLTHVSRETSLLPRCVSCLYISGPRALGTRTDNEQWLKSSQSQTKRAG